MHFRDLFGAVAVAAVAGTASGYPQSPTVKTDALAAVAIAKLAVYAPLNSANRTQGNTCTLATAAKRREWGSLTPGQRIQYTNAVNCLMNKPSRFNLTAVKSRFDDFVAVHINQTFTIHGTASFLSWHRHFVWTYEKALREECGYQGYQPYWNWGRWANDPLNSPIFDGGVASMGGNGIYAEHLCTDALANGINCIPPGAGGGCVQTGPFVNYTVSMGPIFPTLRSADVVAIGFDKDPLQTYNPHCMKRDVSQWLSSRFLQDQNVTDLLVGSPNITSFQTTMQGDFPNGKYGVHAAGHYTIGGDPGGDFFVSPADPAFYLHHGQIDRTWWIWQNQKPAERTNAIGGTITIFNNPPSRDGTLEDPIDLALLGDTIPTSQAMSTLGLTGGPYCYIYV
ncbi:hypothetical protein B0T19DRAFT_487614 [Cercophora scortea]|uniref:Tyrosinase copper-binding domain-containing protein n=1 Tax=Cercophora scortea TaxID=314031 RepID=A0AAE0IA95_9PEZI|nr:hypothetical protein B0T19DRAFT_487614 [Cercophora scortea]